MEKFAGLQLIWLETFVKVAETGKRTAAAAELEIHQGTVTKHIQKLEQWLGGKMLVDSGVPAQLLPDGVTFLPTAKQILQMLHDARRRHDSAGTQPIPATVKDPPNHV
jgi:DNA-binding transcriptional LysR family regulator